RHDLCCSQRIREKFSRYRSKGRILRTSEIEYSCRQINSCPKKPYMTTSPYQHYYDYLSENAITPLYNIRFERLTSLRLNDVLKRTKIHIYSKLKILSLLKTW